jgi:dipeptidyl-peptidase 4
MNNATLPLARRIAAATAVGLFFVLGSAAVHAQGSKADYERSDNLRRLVEGKVTKSRVEPRWFAEGKKFWYRLDLGAGRREFVVVDAEAGERRTAIDHAKLAEELAQKLGRDVDAAKLPIDGIEFIDDGAAVRFPAEGKHWKWTLADSSLAETEAFELPRPAGQPPVRGRRGQQGRGGPPRGGPPGRRPMASGRSRCAITTCSSGRSENIESAPRDQVQPKLHSYDYLKPGDRVAIDRPQLFDLETKQRVPSATRCSRTRGASRDLRWSPDSSCFTFLYNQRGHQVLRIVAVDAETGEARPIVDERSETFVDYSASCSCSYLDATGEILWMSERDGWNHLYLIDAATGEVKHQITQGTVGRAERRAGGRGEPPDLVRAGRDPARSRIRTSCTTPRGLRRLEPGVLTEGNGTHSIQFSPDRRWFIDTWSRVDSPPVTELRSADDGRLVCVLEQADWSSLLETGWQAPEPFVAKGRDGSDRHLRRDLPADELRRRTSKYPVIEDIYAGPQSAFVPKRFSAFHRASRRWPNWASSSSRSTAWAPTARRRFTTSAGRTWATPASPTASSWMQGRRGEKYPGWTWNGSASTAARPAARTRLRGLLAHGDFYQVAVADCGCHDNRMDKIWWNEQWMGWPVGPHYAEQSNVTHAHRSEGKLLLIVGELDRNVDPPRRCRWSTRCPGRQGLRSAGHAPAPGTAPPKPLRQPPPPGFVPFGPRRRRSDRQLDFVGSRHCGVRSTFPQCMAA